MKHAAHHLLAAVGLYQAGQAVTYRRRAGWLTVALVGCVLAHQHHHGGR